MSDDSLFLFVGAGGMLCFIAALGAIGIAIYALSQGKGAASPPAGAPRAPSSAPGPVPSPFGGSGAPHAGAPPSSSEFGDEEMPTVIVSQPPQIRMPGAADAAPPSPAPAPTPSRRTAGATIIAFDDEDDDE